MKAPDMVIQYATDVLEGRIVAGLRTKQACQRFLNDLQRQGTDDFPFVWDPARAERVFLFFRYCRHVKGALARKPIKLEPWQKFGIGQAFGWVHKDTGLRRFRKVYKQVGRGNGKSTEQSGLGLFMLMADGEHGSEVYATATKSEQAHIVYDAARTMATRSPDLIKRLEPGKTKMEYPATDSKFMPLSKDTKSLDGLAPHLGIVDEYHAHQDASMYEVLVSAMGKRRQPMLFVITTAGFELSAPCYEEYTYACKLLDGTLKNEEYLVLIWELDKDDNPQDESVWIKANPLIAATAEGVAYLRGELQAALDVPSKMRNFLTKNMNLWVDQKPDGYMPMEKWKACAVKPEDMPDLTGRDCYIGVDLSAKIDLSSVVFEFTLEDSKYAVLSHSFMPAETLALRRKTDKVPYDTWVKQKFITETDGATVDYKTVMQYIQDRVTANRWRVKALCYDAWNAAQFAQEMQALGYPVVEVVQGIKTLAEPTADFRAQVMNLKVVHDGNEVLTWAMSNAVTRQDHNQNIMLDKAKARQRIDPAAAVMNAHTMAKGQASGKVQDVSEFATEDFLGKLWG